MDFRSIRVHDILFDPLKHGRNGLRYGGNTTIKFQVPRLTYRVSTKIPGTFTFTPTTITFPREFDEFIVSIVSKSGVNCNHPFERVSTTDETILFDAEERIVDDIRPGSTIDASILVSLKGTWTNGITSGLCMDIDQAKMYSIQEPDTTPRVYMNGTLI